MAQVLPSAAVHEALSDRCREQSLEGYQHLLANAIWFEAAKDCGTVTVIVF